VSEGVKLVKPTGSLSGVLAVPGDKSISHRVAMLSAVANGRSTISGFLRSEDCLNTLAAMKTLGAGVTDHGDRIDIEGIGGVLKQPENRLDLGNSGTGIRLLTGLLAGQPLAAELTGDASLRSRPMRRIATPLTAMGASVELLGENGCAPIRVTGAPLNAITYELPMASAQVKSAVLLAGLAVNGETVVIEPRPTRDHTERMMRAMGLDLTVDGLTITLRSSGLETLPLRPGEWSVPGDFSSAAFWIVAAAMIPGRDVVIENVGLNPRRTALLDVLRRMGADIEVTPTNDAGVWEETGTVRVKGADLVATEVSGDEIPNLIDELPLVAVAASLAKGVTVVRDAEELRVKESDRIDSVCRNLKKNGVIAEETPDGFRVTGGAVTGGAVVESFGDHRIAMAMAVLALSAEKPIEIRDVACVATSYPTFWEHLALLAGE
jgi:3-phosphoshikimate 1-carboxyvinyltransferase